MAWTDRLPKFTNLIGIDFGTNRTRIWSDSKGLIIDQPTRLAVDTTDKVVAIGQDAAEMEDRAIKGITVHRPVQRARVFDARVAKVLLRTWLQEVLGLQYLLSPVIMTSVPAGTTQAAHQALIEVMYDVGAREVYTISQPLAAAIGAGVPIADASGTLVFHAGAGVVEVAMISLGSVVKAETDDKAGGQWDTALQHHLRHQSGVLVSIQTAERLKRQMTIAGQGPSGLWIAGQQVATHAPIELQVSVTKLTEALLTISQRYLALIQSLLAQVPPELSGDVLDKGMLLSGGLANLSGLDTWLTDQLGVPVTLVEQPDQVVIQGIGTALHHRHEFKQSLGGR